MPWHRSAVLAAVLAALCTLSSPLEAQDVQDRTAVGQPSLADSTLTQDVWAVIEVWEMAGETPAGCTESPQLGTRVIAEAPKGGDARKHPWVEHWAVRRCEAEVMYRVAFTPARGGTAFAITPVKKDDGQ